jgi:uroporphyrinogen decarboxylase
MNSAERLLTAFRRGTPDRVPVATWLSLKFLDQLTGQSPRQFLNGVVDDPQGTIIKVQEELGLDPIVITFSELEDEVIDWPRRLFRWAPEAFEKWRVATEIIDQDSDAVGVRRTITTPEGQLTSTYRQERYQKWTSEYLVKQERDLNLLKYRPDPQYLDVSPLAEVVRKVGDRGLVLHNFPGVWYEACTLRGLVTVSTDIYDRPEWLQRYLAELTDYLLRLLKRVLTSGIKVLLLDESWVGVGLSAKVYNKYILPYDQQLVAAAQQAGVLVDYHNCGRVTAVLESMAATGADALEPLTPPTLNGDIRLADAKRRVGGRVALYGGFNERVLASENLEEVRQEVRRCIDEAAAGGGYAIRCAGQIFEADLKNIEAMAEAVQRYGQY